MGQILGWKQNVYVVDAIFALRHPKDVGARLSGRIRLSVWPFMHSETAARIFLKIFTHTLPSPERCSVKFFWNPKCRLGVVAIFVKSHYIAHVNAIYLNISMHSSFSALVVSIWRSCRCSKTLQMQEKVLAGAGGSAADAVGSSCRCNRKIQQFIISNISISQCMAASVLLQMGAIGSFCACRCSRECL